MNKTVLAVMIMASACMLMAYGAANAKVQGMCQTCHTMHNSQENQPVAMINATWSGGTTLKATAGTSQTPNQHLLVTDCIGCHSSSDGTTTIVTSGANRVPIVYNLGGYPTIPLAGGNFAGVTASSTNGHHVLTPSTIDINAPGLAGIPGACASGSCHNTLYGPYITQEGMKGAQTGCQGCHYYQFHHKSQGPWDPGTNGMKYQATYRFLSGHSYQTNSNNKAGGMYVVGIEDPGWESTGGSSADHNVYAAPASGMSSGIINASNHSITAFCAACHANFILLQGSNAPNTSSAGIVNTTARTSYNGETGVWFRHPVDVMVSTLITDGHETILYNGSDGDPGDYDPAVPVAYSQADIMTANSGNPVSSLGDLTNVMGGEFTKVTDPTGQVTCLSCHRAHGSPYSYMLRWSYNTMVAGNSTSAGGTGCFVCHTSKSLSN